MREFKLFDAFDALDNAFSFLVEEWGFALIKEENLNYMALFRYRKDKLTILVAYEYMYNMFDFEFIMDEQCFEYIKDEQRQLIFSFFKDREPDIEWKLFQPDDFQYKESLMRNVEYLKKYKDDVLKMAEYGTI